MRRVDGVMLDGQETALAAVLVRIGVAYLQGHNGAVPGEALRLRDQLLASARGNLPGQASGGAGSAEVPAVVVVAESRAEMTTAQAAGGLGISARAVRGLCCSGALIATRSPAGWRIDAGSAAALAARRKEQHDGTQTAAL